MVTEQLIHEKLFVAASILHGCGYLLIMKRYPERSTLQLYQTFLKMHSYK